MTEEEKATRTEQLRGEITEVQAALSRVESDQREALADIASRGTWVMRTVLDSKRKAIRKKGLNSSVSIVTATETMRRTLTKRLASLNASLTTLEKPTNKWKELREQTAQ